MDDILKDAFARVTRTDPVVYDVVLRGLPLELAIVRLAEQKANLAADLGKLASIAPKKLRAADGRVLVWHCPDELVPFAEDNNP